MYSRNIPRDSTTILTIRNKLLVESVEVARGPHIVEQKKAVAGMEVWKRVVEERVHVVDDEMDVDG